MSLPVTSPWLLRLFTRYCQRYASRHFRAVRLLQTARPPVLDAQRSALVYLNHPSWWDPITGILLAQRLFPAWQHFAPIDAKALQRYRFFSRLGMFGVDGSARGRSEFIRIGQDILARPGHMLWITAQGRFTDPRVQPVRLMPGLAHLLRRVPRAQAFPLALEYPLWNERLPEVLAAFGPTVGLEPESHTIADMLAKLESALEATQQDLAAASMRRQPEEFVTLLEGRGGVQRVYDWWRKIRAARQGQSFNPDHGAMKLS